MLKTKPVHVLMHQVIGELRHGHMVDDAALAESDAGVLGVLNGMAILASMALDCEPDMNLAVAAIAPQEVRRLIAGRDGAAAE